MQSLKPDFANIPKGGFEMNKLDSIKIWGGIIVIGFLSVFLGCTANYPASGAASMPLCDSQTILQVAQKTMADLGYSVLQCDPERGLLSVQREFGDIVKTISFHIGNDEDKRVRMMMVLDTSEVIAPPPLGLTRRELVNISRVITKQMGFKEDDVFVQFGKEQKRLSSY
jgi:hypothetical protein